MAERKVTVTDDWTYREIRTVILENEYLKLTVFPEIGFSLIKPDSELKCDIDIELNNHSDAL